MGVVAVDLMFAVGRIGVHSLYAADSYAVATEDRRRGQDARRHDSSRRHLPAQVPKAISRFF